VHDDRSRHINRRGSGHQDDGSGSPGAKQRNAPVGQSLAADLDQGFRLAEAAALPCGQQNSGDARLHTVKATDGPAGHVPQQLLLLGAVFAGIALLSDSTWAMAAGSARAWFGRSPRRLELIGGSGGLVMIGIGATLAVSGRKD
jgi:hypothetical protein